MRQLLLTLMLLATVSCASSEIYSDAELELLRQDADNKNLEATYLREIAIAQQNQDSDAFKYFLDEYMKVPRLEIPEHLKTSSEYVHRKTAAEINKEFRD
tara:strand:- start:185 stop:484 length:300 start_codon:yes stop_codon:yes gene_type:complete